MVAQVETHVYQTPQQFIQEACGCEDDDLEQVLEVMAELFGEPVGWQSDDDLREVAGQAVDIIEAFKLFYSEHPEAIDVRS